MFRGWRRRRAERVRQDYTYGSRAEWVDVVVDDERERRERRAALARMLNAPTLIFNGERAGTDPNPLMTRLAEVRSSPALRARLRAHKAARGEG